MTSGPSFTENSTLLVHELTLPVRHLQAVLLRQNKIDSLEFTPGTCADPAYTWSGFLGNRMRVCVSAHQLRKQTNLASRISSSSQQSGRKWGSACPSKKKKKRLKDFANLWLQGEGWGEGIVREFGMDMYTLLYLKWVTFRDLLCSTWNCAQCFLAAWMGGKFERGWIRVYVWPSPFTVHLKLSQHC